MRNRVISLTAALVLASASFAIAQAAKEQQKPEEAAAAPKAGMVEVASRMSSVSGDEARYERYRDLRNGANINFAWSRESAGYVFDASAANIGYRDGHYVLNYQNGRVKFSFVYDRLPLNYSYDTSTPWVEAAPNDFKIDPYIRSQAQGPFSANGGTQPAVILLPGNLVGIPRNKTEAGYPSIYRGLATPFDMSSQRDTIGAAFEFKATDTMTATASVNSYSRTGNMPWGASFAFNNAAELPVTVDNRTTDFSTGLEYANQKGSVRVGYDGSLFQQHSPFLMWDNPLYATDYNCTAFTPLPAGCSAGAAYDPNGYSNGRGPARGRMSMAPTNQMNSVNAVALYKLPSHSTLSGNFFVTSMTQNSVLAPWTTNPVIANPLVYASFPELAELPRERAEASLLYTNIAVNFTSRPNKMVNFNVKYRFNDRSDRTPTFDAVEYVRFDAVPEEIGGETEPFNVKRSTFDASVGFNVLPFTALRVGYISDSLHHERAFGKLHDGIFRVSADVIGTQYLTVRALYEITNRNGSDFDQAALTDGGAQPASRWFDDAERTRKRTTLILDVTPISMMGVSFSYARGKDDYNDPAQEFGLLNNENTAYTIGLNITPKDQIRFGFDYGYEKFDSLFQSRNASPAPDPQWTDPNRNWTLANPEKIKNYSIFLDLLKAIAKTDIRFGYDFSDSDQAFTHGGPRVNPAVAGSLAAAGQFVALPNVTNSWKRATLDIKYYLTPKVGVGGSWWYEKFDVSDWATVNFPYTQTPRIDYLGAITTGYGNRPYSGNTGFVRVFYLF